MNETIMTTSAVGLAPKFYETRHTARFLLGDGYQARMKELGAMVAKVAAGRRVVVSECAALDRLMQLSVALRQRRRESVAEVTRPSLQFAG